MSGQVVEREIYGGGADAKESAGFGGGRLVSKRGHPSGEPQILVES